MVTSTTAVIYPDSDGKPMSDNTKQFEWIVYIKKGLDLVFQGEPLVFVAGDLLWYPVEGNSKICQAPDTMVVFGRPKGDRGSYRQWTEADIPPQVVFEVIAPSNTIVEMSRKFQFYQHHGVEEYYIWDPDRLELGGFRRAENWLLEIETIQDWVSPRLGVRFSLNETGALQLFRPDGESFETFEQLARRADQERQRADQAELQVAQQSKARTAAEERAERLALRLRALGIDPEETTEPPS